MERAKVSNVKVNEQSMMAHDVVDTIHFIMPTMVQGLQY
jgi:hypothetical protein